MKKDVDFSYRIEKIISVCVIRITNLFIRILKKYLPIKNNGLGLGPAYKKC
jgi:hypothetical protein